MRKRGQVQLSFGMIFSIIIIIATVAVAFYVLTRFVSLGNTISCSQFYAALQEEIDDAWNGESSKLVFEKAAPSDISAVCIGSLEANTVLPKDRSIFLALKDEFRGSGNLYFYPLGSSCGGSSGFTLKHIQETSFGCARVVDGKVSITVSKASNEGVVRLLV
ncbi:MAG TPA: hypothetical protein VJK51_03175 [Candidatus Nanoarchaeia archaeon]|nr:hypothetical protein [Candidatus Nanoarchaeia archaeon]